MKLAVLDTSVLLLIARGSINLDSLREALAGYRLCVTKPVVEELGKLSRGSDERSRLAAWLRENVVGKLIDVINEDCEGREFDERIVCSAKKLDAVLITADREMSKRARSVGVRVAMIRWSKRGIEEFFSIL